jgi:hypothetical protein
LAARIGQDDGDQSTMLPREDGRWPDRCCGSPIDTLPPPGISDSRCASAKFTS